MAKLLGSAKYSVTRRGPGGYVAGEWVDGPSTALSITASIQSMSQGELREELPEGYRTSETAKVYTRDTLQTLNLATQTKGDLITYLERSWEVVQSADWTDHPRSTAHRRYVIARLGVDEP